MRTSAAAYASGSAQPDNLVTTEEPRVPGSTRSTRNRPGDGGESDRNAQVRVYRPAQETARPTTPPGDTLTPDQQAGPSTHPLPNAQRPPKRNIVEEIAKIREEIKREKAQSEPPPPAANLRLITRLRPTPGAAQGQPSPSIPALPANGKQANPAGERTQKTEKAPAREPHNPEHERGRRRTEKVLNQGQAPKDPPPAPAQGEHIKRTGASKKTARDPATQAAAAQKPDAPAKTVRFRTPANPNNPPAVEPRTTWISRLFKPKGLSVQRASAARNRAPNPAAQAAGAQKPPEPVRIRPTSNTIRRSENDPLPAWASWWFKPRGLLVQGVMVFGFVTGLALAIAVSHGFAVIPVALGLTWLVVSLRVASRQTEAEEREARLMRVLRPTPPRPDANEDAIAQEARICKKCEKWKPQGRELRVVSHLLSVWYCKQAALDLSREQLTTLPNVFDEFPHLKSVIITPTLLHNHGIREHLRQPGAPRTPMTREEVVQSLRIWCERDPGRNKPHFNYLMEAWDEKLTTVNLRRRNIDSIPAVLAEFPSLQKIDVSPRLLKIRHWHREPAAPAPDRHHRQHAQHP